MYRWLFESLQRRIPGFKIRDKRKSALFRFLSWFSKIFLRIDISRQFVTTLGTTVWYPGTPDWNRVEDASVIYHESIHAADFVSHPVLFVLGYTFPQNLAVLSLGSLSAIWIGWPGLLFLLFLLSLAPWPAPFRVRYELRGYAGTMAVLEAAGSPLPQLSWWVAIFCGPAYYRMSWNKKKIAGLVSSRYWRELTPELPNSDLLTKLKEGCGDAQ